MLLNLWNKNANNPEVKTYDSEDKPNEPKIEPKKEEIKQNEQDTKPRESGIKPDERNTGPKKEKIDTQQPEIWKFKYENLSKDRNDYVFSYVVWSKIKGYWTILNELWKELKLKFINWIRITDSKWKDIRGPFKNEKIYIKIPKYCIETNTIIIDNMKCKWWEYFWIDVSRYNSEINLTSFEERNKGKWESTEKDKRWVSFIYIRAGDGISSDVAWDKESIKRRTDFIKKHNDDITVKNNNEQIASWFYWTLTNKKDAITQADDFLKIYNNFKDIPWWNKLVPMIDLETARFTEVKRSHKNKKGKTVIDERYTPQQFKENALKWLQYIEQKTWVVPGIYVWADPYGRYIKWDKRFNKYLTRLTAYPDSRTGREIGTARRINLEEWSVKVWPSSKTIDIKPDMYQSSQEWSVAWTSAKVTENRGKKNEKTYHDTDMDHTKDITKLFSKNNKSK